MCFNLADFDTFEPLYILELDGSEHVDTEPMNDDDWEEWLANE